MKPKRVEKAYECGNCSGVVQRGFTFCPYCGYVVNWEKEETVEVRNCNYPELVPEGWCDCGAVLNGRMTHCPSCERKIEWYNPLPVMEEAPIDLSRIRAEVDNVITVTRWLKIELERMEAK